MVVYGDSSNYFISISTTIDGSGDPTGDVVWLYSKTWVNPRVNKDKMKEMANNNSYNNRMGKMAREVNLTDCVLYNDDVHANNNTESYNKKITLLDYWCDLAKSAVYLIVRSKTDNKKIAISRSGANELLYMKGVIKKFRPRPDGNVYLLDLAFKETTLY